MDLTESLQKLGKYAFQKGVLPSAIYCTQPFTDILLFNPRNMSIFKRAYQQAKIDHEKEQLDSLKTLFGFGLEESPKEEGQKAEQKAECTCPSYIIASSGCRKMRGEDTCAS